MEDNKAEIAEVHWRIYLTSAALVPRSLWRHLWAPRDRLDWTRTRHYESDSSAVSRNFLASFNRAMSNPGKNWVDEADFVDMQEKCLSGSVFKYLEAGLLNLAERAHRKNVELLLTAGKVARSVALYHDFASRLLGISDISVAVALGLYYRVVYIGKLIPSYLRGNEYIFRNANSLHLSDFGTKLCNDLSKLIGGVRVTLILDSAKIPSIADSLHIPLYLVFLKV